MAPESRLLVVDDDGVSRHLLGQMLAGAGLGADVVASGAEALAYLDSHPAPAAILLDLVMPEPDGYAVLRHVRSQPRLAEVPVVVLTALETDGEIERAFSSGADDYVQKPFRPGELLARLRVQMRVRDYLDRLARRDRDQQTLLELTQALASSLDIRDILYTVVKRIADVVRVDRCSVVLLAESGRVGFVLASSDDDRVRDRPIMLDQYPEIREVVATGRALVIHNAADSPLLEVVRQRESARGFSSLALLPIMHDQGRP
ncbi:MAG TPA: response regulator, partial [Polyangiaceae bacterium]|nr:response regulator [Polyangiaceae bacterium]